ncbi:MAG: DnaJ domain-containing protein [Clostridia bacterium]|nr:DnaJ domain-containing protein [Clostridia bacterium]
MKDPYKVLGVNPNATDDEVKKAYRNLAKKYHPDTYVGNPLADLAAEKMKEINEAYDTITKQRAARNQGGGYSTGRSGYSAGGNAGGDTLYRVRELLSANRVTEAETILSRIPEGQRSAEWYFLMGHVMARKNWLGEARKYFEQACKMDPYNAEYRNTLNNMSSHSSSSTYTTSAKDDDCGFCEICAGMLCADMLCNCCR